MESKISNFVSLHHIVNRGCDGSSNSGVGYGVTNGDGKGNGYSHRDAHGNGSGGRFCYGTGFYYRNETNGDWYGCGRGRIPDTFDGIKSINGMDIYSIDWVPTIITHVHGNFAKGYIVEVDLSLHPCYIAKGGEYFAHGDTAREACAALEDKIITHMDTKERIKMFLDHFADLGKMYPAREFFEWHSKLTGSCLPGREAFAKAHDIDVDTAEYTVQEFIDLTHDAWGGEVIRELEERLKCEK